MMWQIKGRYINFVLLAWLLSGHVQAKSGGYIFQIYLPKGWHEVLYEKDKENITAAYIPDDEESQTSGHVILKSQFARKSATTPEQFYSLLAEDRQKDCEASLRAQVLKQEQKGDQQVLLAMISCSTGKSPYSSNVSARQWIEGIKLIQLGQMIYQKSYIWQFKDASEDFESLVEQKRAAVLDVVARANVLDNEAYKNAIKEAYAQIIMQSPPFGTPSELLDLSSTPEKW